MTPALRFALPLAAALILPAAHAVAADLDPPVYVDQGPDYTPVEVGSGWYLRGDVGYILKSDVKDYEYRTFDGLDYGDATFNDSDLDGDFTFGGGFGYRFNDFLRAEANVDGFRASFGGSTASDAPCTADAALIGTTCHSRDDADMSAISVMANGYIDLGTFVGVTPYVGAGAGYTYVTWSGLDSKNTCVDGVAVCPTPNYSDTISHGGDKDWRFTYAFMAGAAYDITQNLKLDVGYKYRHIDGGDMFDWDALSKANGASGTQGKDGDLSQHEIKVGLRYELW